MLHVDVNGVGVKNHIDSQSVDVKSSGVDVRHLQEHMSCANVRGQAVRHSWKSAWPERKQKRCENVRGYEKMQR